MANDKIGFIGCGNIASAIIGGSVNSGYIKPQNIYVFDTDSTKKASFCELGANCLTSASALVNECDFVFLTVKPQVYASVLDEIKAVADNTCFVAVAAGITISYIKAQLGFDAPVVRVMPNTPLMFSEGAAAIVRDSAVTNEQFEFVRGFFSCCGIVEEVSEDNINTVTAISGSAPAYVMRFAKNFIEYAVENGMTVESAEALVLKAISGTAEMVRRSDESIDRLIRNVTSPNGTTEAGLRSMDENGFDETVKACLTKTENRAKELTR